MIKSIIYTTSDITNNKIRRRNLIPYRITSKNIKYETNRWYYNAYWNQIMKVTSVKYNDNGELEQCFVMWEDDLFGMICTDLDVNYDYKLEYDRKKIYKQDIINSTQVFTGAEIIYWFFINGITYDNKKYKGFWKYVDLFSDHRLSDYNKYVISATYLEDKDIYVNCKVKRVSH